MRKRTSMRVAGAIAAGAASIAVIPVLPAVGEHSPPVGDHSPSKVEMCHKPGTPAEKTLTVSQSAAEAHARHGDTPGPCPDED